MKLILQSRPKPKAAHSGTVISKSVFDDGVMYVGRRVKVSAIRMKALGLDIPKLEQTGYLVVKGVKPGMLVHEVKWDGKDLYARKSGTAMTYGSLAALNSTKQKGFEAEIVSAAELQARAVKFNQVKTVTHAVSGRKHDVALLNRWDESYVVGLESAGHGKFRVLNMEHKQPWNDHAKHVRYENPVDSNTTAKAYLK